MSAKKILVVEDDKASAMLMAYKLKGSGYTVVFAPDGCEAISQIRSENPDLMILDLALPSRNPFAGPQWDGFSLMDWLSRSRPTEPIPIVVVTACDSTKSKKRALDAGAIAYFQKPAQFDALLAAIRGALGETSNPSPASSVNSPGPPSGFMQWFVMSGLALNLAGGLA